MSEKPKWSELTRESLERIARASHEFLSDWEKGDFSLSTLAALDAGHIAASFDRAVTCEACQGHGVVGGFSRDGSFDGQNCPECLAATDRWRAVKSASYPECWGVECDDEMVIPPIGSELTERMAKRIAGHLNEATPRPDNAASEVVRLRAALEGARSALANIISPTAIKLTGVLSAYTQATEAEAKARAILATEQPHAS